ncbi:O-antigen/teichoic acid export membrane protein [Mumia flava]|uniref:O-antigen/teichoic acid export membrane protein n=1 Tax=Mumia flava TaxID=1348852 RepID=A0A2M9BK46_9ACTN|nr:polysaccharide biosynthesis protein [Mumia flava]PJJ58324.1 O-antigen/teichoic acid export membrane protein [Mumia flava]
MSVLPGSRMERNAGVLLLSSAATSILGFAYWYAAERTFATAEVGRASTVVTTATMLGTLACLSLGGMYERFLPASGHRVRALIAGGIGAVGLSGMLIGCVFAAIDPSPAMFDASVERVAFPAVVVALALFALADPIAVGLREPRAVAAKNVGFGVAKLAVLVPLAGTGAVAIYGSWTLLALVATTTTLVWALARGSRAVAAADPTLPRVRLLLSHHGAVLALMLVGTVTPLCLPLIVLDRLGPESAAHFNVAQVIVVAVTMMIAACGSSFIAEAAQPGADPRAALRQLARMLVALGLAGAAGLALIGPLMLRLVGVDYAAESGRYLQVAGAALLPQTFVGAYALLCRLESRLRLLVAVQVVAVVGIIGGTLLLVDALGVTGVGVAMLATESACAAIVAVPTMLAVRRITGASRDDAPGRHPAVGAGSTVPADRRALR